MGHSLIQEPPFVKDALLSERQRFWKRFLELGFPAPKQEAFQYLPRRAFALPPGQAAERSLDPSELEPHLLPSCEGRIVFVNGFFSPELSQLPKECILLPLSDAMKVYGLVLQNRHARILKEETDPFAALNGAVHGRGAFFYLPPGVVLERPVQLLSFFLSEDSMSQRLQLFLGKGAKADLLQTLIGGGSAIELIDVVLDADSRLSLSDQSKLQPNAVCFKNLRASLKRNASLSSFSFSEGATLLRRSCSVALLEEGAETHLKGLDTLAGECEAHTHVLVEHRAPHCLSRQHFKKALRGKSRSSFEGKIYVHSEAQKTEAYQLNQNLILSSEAAAHAKPNLEIFADDVKASHGATFSQLNEEEIFYFRSRGLSIAEAKGLLFRGFCSELLRDVAEPQRQDLQTRISQ